MKPVFAVLALVTLLFGSPADACNRCGYRTSCRYVTTQAYVQPAAVAPSQQNVYVIQNSTYPQPLVGQGTSSIVSNGGYQSQVLPLFDPTSYFSQSLQLIRAANDTSALQAERTASLVQRVAELQAPSVEKLASGQAAAMVLQAAGLDPAHNSVATSTAVVVTRDSNGQTQVLPIEMSKVQQITAASQTQTTITTTNQAAVANPPAAVNPNDKYPMTTLHCGSCHGQSLASPKGGFYISSDPGSAKLMMDKFWKIQDMVSSGSMPKGASTSLDIDTKRKIMDEIDLMIRSSLATTPKG